MNDTMLCKGGCGKVATHKGWCKIKWSSGNKFGVACSKIEEKRGKSISVYRLKESAEGKNPMQNPEICKKNHTIERNKKASTTLKALGKLGMLPQQTETLFLKEKRRRNVIKSLNEMWQEGRHPRQLETFDHKLIRLKKMSNTLKKLGVEGKLPVQNFTSEKKQEIASKVSKKLIEGIKSGKIKLSPSWKRIKYKKYVLRSGWEKVMAKFLDRNHLKWNYETLKVGYFDSVQKVDRVTIPDFYLPDKNIVIEVKSNAEFYSQKTKDKSKAIVQSGFKFLLAGRKEIKMITTDEKQFLSRLESF